MEEAKEVLVRRNADVARDYEARERQGKEELDALYEELERLKSDQQDFAARNLEYKAECDRLRGEATLKETAVEKLEKEINMLNEQIELKRKMQRD